MRPDPAPRPLGARPGRTSRGPLLDWHVSPDRRTAAARRKAGSPRAPPPLTGKCRFLCFSRCPRAARLGGLDVTWGFAGGPARGDVPLPGKSLKPAIFRQFAPVRAAAAPARCFSLCDPRVPGKSTHKPKPPFCAARIAQLRRTARKTPVQDFARPARSPLGPSECPQKD